MIFSCLCSLYGRFFQPRVEFLLFLFCFTYIFQIIVIETIVAQRFSVNEAESGYALFFDSLLSMNSKVRLNFQNILECVFDRFILYPKDFFIISSLLVEACFSEPDWVFVFVIDLQFVVVGYSPCYIFCTIFLPFFFLILSWTLDTSTTNIVGNMPSEAIKSNILMSELLYSKKLKWVICFLSLFDCNILRNFLMIHLRIRFFSVLFEYFFLLDACEIELSLALFIFSFLLFFQCPIQWNGSDCGIHVIMNVEKFLESNNPVSSFVCLELIVVYILFFRIYLSLPFFPPPCFSFSFLFSSLFDFLLVSLVLAFILLIFVC